jgi:hypothetical protein
VHTFKGVNATHSVAYELFDNLRRDDRLAARGINGDIDSFSTDSMIINGLLKKRLVKLPQIASCQ